MDNCNDLPPINPQHLFLQNNTKEKIKKEKKTIKIKKNEKKIFENLDNIIDDVFFKKYFND